MNALEQWHQAVKSGDSDLLNELLAENCVFHSPVVHTPQQGRDICKVYLTAAMHVLSGLEYVREITNEHTAALEFETEIDGISINGVDLITWNDAGKIVDFKVMLRPLKAINLIHQKMGAKLQEFNS